jgi:short-subunit dehydrogenase
MGGRMVLPGGGWYHASKYAVEALSDALRFEVRPFGVDVVLIEPGVVVTEFGDTALGTVTDSSDLSGPYETMMADIATTFAGAYERPKRGSSIPVDVVATRIQKAIESRRPRTRYVIGAQARQLVYGRALLPGRAWDAVIGTQFTKPTPD